MYMVCFCKFSFSFLLNKFFLGLVLNIEPLFVAIYFSFLFSALLFFQVELDSLVRVRHLHANPYSII